MHTYPIAKSRPVKWARLLCALLTVCLLGTVWAASAPAAEKTVRFGYYDYGDLMSQSGSGEYTGFCVEYLQEISKYTGWSYEMVDCGDWDTAQSMLKRGQVDLLPAVFYLEDRIGAYLYPELSMCDIYTTLNTRPTDYRYYYEDFPSFNGMRVGVIKNSKDAANFVQYCLENNFTVEQVTYDDTNTALSALKSGYLDAVAITYLGRSHTFRSIAQFSSEPIYVAVANGKEDLLGQLNEAQSTIKLHNPDYGSSLYQKYFSISPDQRPVFTRSEHEYLSGAPEITAVYDAGWAPLEYTDPATGEFRGIVADLFGQISEDTGLTFRFIAAKDYQAALALSQGDDVDLLCAMTSDYTDSRKQGLTNTQYFLRVPVALVSASQENGSPKRIGALRGYLGDVDLIQGDASRSVTYYDSPTECFEALRAGELDGAYVNSYTADYMLSKDRYHNFTLTTLTNYAEEVSIGISTSADSRLFSILDKSIHFIASEQMDKIILNNSIYAPEVTWQAMLRQHPLSIFLGLVFTFGTVILLLSIVLISKSRSNKKIQGLINLDTLTGLLNLNKFAQEAGKLIEVSQQGTYAIVYIDIKQFKAINDTMGFAEGDAILKALADVLRASLTPGELCGRVSADHFIALIYHSGEAGMSVRCADIAKTLNLWAEQGGKHYHLVLAYGIYLVDEAEKGDVALMMDLANYARRSISSVAHKSNVVLYDAAMRKEGLRMRDLSDRMQAALDAGEFLPYFQPKVDMATGKLVGSEALVRWNHPSRGIIPPGEFIPYFEKNGFVLELDLYVYEQVCKALQCWLAEGREVAPVSCNFSRIHTSDELFPSKLLGIADRYEVPLQYLELEVTESVFMRDIETFTKQFDLLKSMGFPISIDDFGSGYSSLGLLQRFPVDVIKLDRSFIQEGIRSRREQLVLRGVVSMAKALGVAVICEGVETLEQANILQKLGCHMAQGFYYARPMPRADFEQFMDRASHLPDPSAPADTHPAETDVI